MIGPSLGQEENVSANSRLYDGLRISHEEEEPQENIVILDANNSIFSEINSENRPTRLEVVIVQGTWNESDENTNLTLTSDIFADLEAVECNNERNATNIVSGIIENELGFSGEYMLEDNENSTAVEKDPLSDDSCVKENDENNLLWLLNYKLDSMFNVDDIDHDHNYPGNEYEPNGKISCFKDTVRERSSSSGGILGTRFYPGESYNFKGRRGPNPTNSYRRSLPSFSTTSSIHPSTSPVLSTNLHSNYQGCNSVLRKPPFTYTEMIEQALSESGELTVSGIYNWISEHFPFYKANDDRWKNSVRHNLSINPHFKKGSKARHGAGHLWTIATQEDRPRTASRKRRLEQFWAQTSSYHPPSTGRTSPTTLAVESITLPENNAEMNCMGMGNRLELAMLEEVKTQDINVSMEDNKENSEKRTFIPQVFCPISYNGPKPHIVSLEQSAEEILSGVKREVEVQYLTPLQQKRAAAAVPNAFSINPKETAGHILFPADFLNPVSKREVVEESGLFVLDDGAVASFIVADENFPGVMPDIENGEVIVSDNLFGEDLNFQYQEMVSPQAAQQLHV